MKDVLVNGHLFATVYERCYCGSSLIIKKHYIKKYICLHCKYETINMIFFPPPQEYRIRYYELTGSYPLDSCNQTIIKKVME